MLTLLVYSELIGPAHAELTVRVATRRLKPHAVDRAVVGVVGLVASSYGPTEARRGPQRGHGAASVLDIVHGSTFQVVGVDGCGQLVRRLRPTVVVFDLDTCTQFSAYPMYFVLPVASH